MTKTLPKPSEVYSASNNGENIKALLRDKKLRIDDYRSVSVGDRFIGASGGRTIAMVEPGSEVIGKTRFVVVDAEVEGHGIGPWWE